MPARVLGLLLFAALNGSAHAITGNALLEIAKQDRSMAAVYIAGIVDGSQGYRASVSALRKVPIPPEVFCAPTGSDNMQAADIVMKFLESEPAQRHLSASVLVFVALTKSWPCQADRP